MSTFMLALMALLLIVALERNHRRQPPHPPGPYGAHDRKDRDWDRIQLELLSLGGRAELGHRPDHAPRAS